MGAVLQLGHCCDFLDSKFTNMIGRYYQALEVGYGNAGKKLPVNIDSQNDKHKDKLIRKLDCPTIQFMHEAIEKQYKEGIQKRVTANTRYLTLHVVFLLKEGQPLPVQVSNEKATFGYVSEV